MAQETQLNVLTPKFLTENDARFAIQRVVGWVFDESFPLKRHMCHVVILVPSIQDHRHDNGSDYANYQPLPYLFCELSFGGDEEWPHDFRKIARSKAEQLWYDCNDGRTDIMPHLLFSGDTPYWGGMKREGIVVACSGVQPWFDRMISGMIADMLIALAYDRWMTSKDKEEGVSFLT